MESNTLTDLYYTAGIISAIATVGVLAAALMTIIKQGKQMKQQKKDFDESFANQKMSFEKQLDIANKQLEQNEQLDEVKRFENTFFNMLNLQQEIVNNLYFSYEQKIYTHTETYKNLNRKYYETLKKEVRGRELFEFLFVKHEYKMNYKGFPERNYQGMKETICVHSLNGYAVSSLPPYFDHYFRHLYRILKFVDESKINNKYDYTSILRATLSRYELVWLFYNCLSVYGRVYFKPYIEKYSMLKNIRANLLTCSWECEQVKHELTKKNQSISEKKDKLYIPKNDYDFYQTNKKNEEKYYLSAFYSKEQLPRKISNFDSLRRNNNDV